ncbi:dipeptide ABC transporter ATP-binding protein [Agromyces allii]|uniref:ABC transporter ATP-binding protein n=1 Tax=Agromyces allii TaxID=393607 RepID=A0ABN2RB02_9MICO|nr:ABC transporter ATP-binding protein [Agromyces allii]
MTTPPLLQVADLSVRYSTDGDDVLALDRVSLSLERGERLAVIGESGSGKSTLTHVLLGILSRNAHVTAARGELDGVDLFGGLTETQWTELRRSRVAYIPQDPNIALNPVLQIGRQLDEALRLSPRKVEKLRRRDEAIALLERVGIADAERVYASYPHQVSGGQRQRVLIAIALVGRPRLIVADEPTSGLDVTVQKTVLDALDELVAETGVSLILVTHDLAVARQRTDRVLVLERGRVVESGATAAVTDDPRHAYTRRLLDAVPSLHEGKLAPTPGLSQVDPGHREGGLVAQGLVKTYVTRDPRRGKILTPAVGGVDLAIEPGTTYGLVGESGSGKSTIARIVAGIDRADEGSVHFRGQDVARARGADLRTLRTRIQYVFQNPYTSLNPRFRIFDVVAEPLRGFKVASGAELDRRVRDALDVVGLEPSIATRTPTELSGGQRQRVAIARSIVLRPELIVLDEPVSALDVSVQAQIMQLLIDLQHEFGAAYLFISHDLAVIRELSDRVGVLRRGELLEEGPVGEVFAQPKHEYTRRLIDSIPQFA